MDNVSLPQEEDPDANQGKTTRVWLYLPEKEAFLSVRRAYSPETYYPEVFVLMALQELNLDPIYRTVEQHEGVVTVTWSGNCTMLVEDREQEWGLDDNKDMFVTYEELMNTVGMTLLEGIPSVRQVVFQFPEKEEFSGIWTPPELVRAEFSDGELRAIMEEAPYAGMRQMYDSRVYKMLAPQEAELDETGEKLAEYLWYFCDFGQEFETVAELNQEYKRDIAYHSTKMVWYPYVGGRSPAHMQIRFMPTTQDTYTLVPHMERTGKTLFGADFTLEGVRVQYMTGGPTHGCPMIYHYEDLGDSYRVQLRFLNLSPLEYAEYTYSEDWPDYWTEQAALGPTSEVVLDKNWDGSLTLRSHRYL